MVKIKAVVSVLATTCLAEWPLRVKGGRPFRCPARVARGRCSPVSGRREHDPTANSTLGLAQETIEAVAAGFRIPALDPGVAWPRAIRGVRARFDTIPSASGPFAEMCSMPH
jgi:hypothetical protein